MQNSAQSAGMRGLYEEMGREARKNMKMDDRRSEDGWRQEIEDGINPEDRWQMAEDGLRTVGGKTRRRKVGRQSKTR